MEVLPFPNTVQGEYNRTYCKIKAGAKDSMPTVPVPLTSEEEAALIAQAKAQGVSVNSLVRKAVLQMISSSSGTSLQAALPLTAEEFDKAFDEIADLIPKDAPTLSDAALSRENIYTREDDWNLNR